MRVYLSLGSNLGDKEGNLRHAAELLSRRVGRLVKMSQLYYSAAWGFESKNSFINCCVAIETDLSPFELLDTIEQIEREMGRQHKSRNGHYEDRLIDIDILYYDDWKIESERLTIPHPHIEERDFVRIPLSEIKQTIA